MTLRRDWSEDRREKEWNYIDALTVDSERRYDGPHDSPLQLPIPSWITGDSAEVNEIEDFETRMLSTSSKGSKWGNEEHFTKWASVRSGVSPSTRQSVSQSACLFDRATVRPSAAVLGVFVKTILFKEKASALEDCKHGFNVRAMQSSAPSMQSASNPVHWSSVPVGLGCLLSLMMGMLERVSERSIGVYSNSNRPNDPHILAF